MKPENLIPDSNPNKNFRPGSVMCPHCSARVQAVRLERHILRRHSETLPPVPDPQLSKPVTRKSSPFETCAVCGKTMHRRILLEHRKQHETPKTPRE
jgi:hypothetical protein